MCYTGGPRCAADLQISIDRTEKAIETAIKNGDMEGFMGNQQELEDLKMQFDGTKTGQAILESEIEKAETQNADSNTLSDLMDRKELAKKLRNAELAARRERATLTQVHISKDNLNSVMDILSSLGFNDSHVSIFTGKVLNPGYYYYDKATVWDDRNLGIRVFVQKDNNTITKVIVGKLGTNSPYFADKFDKANADLASLFASR